jgi:hypothetical protein
MKTIIFNPNGGPLTASAVFKGKMVANYEIFLREKDSNAQTSLLSGDNINPGDDKTVLPVPVGSNDGRRVIMDTGFYGSDVINNPDYEIRLEIYQDDKMLGFENDTGTLTGKAQSSTVFIKLTI